MSPGCHSEQMWNARFSHLLFLLFLENSVLALSLFIKKRHGGEVKQVCIVCMQRPLKDSPGPDRVWRIEKGRGVTSHTTWLLLLHPQSQDLHQPHLLALLCLSLPLLPGSASWAPWWPWAWTTGKLQTIAPAFTCPTCSLQSSSCSHPGLSPHCFLSGPHSSPFSPTHFKEAWFKSGPQDSSPISLLCGFCIVLLECPGYQWSQGRRVFSTAEW